MKMMENERSDQWKMKETSSENNGNAICFSNTTGSVKKWKTRVVKMMKNERSGQWEMKEISSEEWMKCVVKNERRG